jgi:exodeoxyribonuclease VII small subunit
MATPSFEKDLEKLESVVAALEEGSLSLDDSLKRFEEGIKLYKRCQKALTDAEKRIEVLTKNSEGELEAEPFDEENADDDVPPAKARAASKPASVPPSHNPPETDPDIDEDDEDDGDLLF